MEIKGHWESYLHPHSGVSRGTSEQLVAECLMVRGERPAAVLIHEARAVAAGKAVKSCGHSVILKPQGGKLNKRV